MRSLPIAVSFFTLVVVVLVTDFGGAAAAAPSVPNMPDINPDSGSPRMLAARRRTATPTPTPTARPRRTATPTASPTPDPQPSPTPTSPPGGNTCAEIHDRYVVTAPDGQQYPTWHPPADPATGCRFGHEHGADPRTAGASQDPPAFGYAAAQMGMTEPHEGFKVFILNSGDRGDDGRTLRADYRIVFHMGTSGTKRYTEQFHSVIYDYVARDGSGRFAHVQGMADTAPANLDGSTCDLPRRGGKDFSTVGCEDTYEIWGFTFAIMHPNDPFQDPRHVRTYLSGSVAAFDPVLTRDPADNNRVLYTQTYRGDQDGKNKNLNPQSTQANYMGCQREAYGGPNYWANAGNPTVYYTDAMGMVQPGPGPGRIKQQISAVETSGNEIYKIRQDFCGNGIHAPN
jgi:hypothetical protein